MSLKLASLNPYSRPGLSQLPSTIDVETDGALQALADNIDLLFGQFGAMVTPAQNLQAALSRLDDNGVLVLLPGEYSLNGNLTINRGCQVIGLGDVRITLGPTHTITLQGDYCLLADLCVARNTRGALGAIHVSGEHCKVKDVRTTGPTPNAVYVSGAHAMIAGVWAAGDGGHLATDADVYIDDAAAYATILGTSWSQSREFAVSYKGLTNASEAANGPAGIIEVR